MTDPIKAKIIQLIPERSGYEYGTVYCNLHDFRSHGGDVVDCPDCKPGSDTITLADVLRAIEKSVSCEEQRAREDFEGEIYQLVWHRWNLPLDYDGQTQEVKEFIGKLLNV